jgi:hypothetical protein
MLKHAVTALITVVALCLASIGFACTPFPIESFRTDSSLPAIVFEDFEVKVNSILRGDSLPTDCGSNAGVDLRIDPVDPEVGYTVTRVEGRAPQHLSVFSQALLPRDGGIWISWTDELSDEQPPVDFTLRVTAIGPNGDKGPSRDVVVTDGSDEGCSATGHQDVSVLGLLVLGLLLPFRQNR